MEPAATAAGSLQDADGEHSDRGGQDAGDRPTEEEAVPMDMADGVEPPPRAPGACASGLLRAGTHEAGTHDHLFKGLELGHGFPGLWHLVSLGWLRVVYKKYFRPLLRYVEGLEQGFLS